MNKRVQSIVSELKRYLEKVYGQRLAGLMLFGSQARGDAAPASDIDVLVVLRGAVHPGIEITRVGNITAMLSLQNNVVISCTFVSANRYAREDSPLLMNIRREGVLV